MNQCQLIGRLVKDPELRYSPSGIPVCRFTLAVNRPFTNANGGKEADFINCVVWRKQAENLANYQKKGNRIAIIGSIQTSSYEKDGQRVYVTEVNVNNIEFLDYKENTQNNAQNQGYNQSNNQGNSFSNPMQQNASTAQNQPNNDPFNTSFPDIDDNLPF